MIRQLFPVSALLFGSGLLLMAGGINGLILPVRGSAEGFSAFSLGLLGTGWAVGYVSGCLYTPKLVSNAGHIRSFGVMCALASVSILSSLLLLDPVAWIILRSISGFCFAGAAMIVESWLSERADPSSRGKIFGIYTMVNLLGATAGQMSITLGETGGYTFFVVGAILYCLALVPTAISSSTSPKPLVSVKLDVGALWRNSPIAVCGAFLVGISNSAFGTLAAVYADRIGLTLAAIALFTSLPILAGAAAQIPVGIISDRTDRRKVLVAITITAMIADIAFISFMSEDQTINLLLACMFGATVYAMYPVIVAHANDHASEGSSIQVSGGLLMVFGVGSIIGPFIAGIGMSTVGNYGLFMTTLAAHIALVAFAIWRIRTRAPVTEEDKRMFAFSPQARASTPQTAVLAEGEEGSNYIREN